MEPEVSPDLARKALQADVRNTLQDVAQGGTLPTPKRQLFMGVITDAASPGEILQSREAALLRKFAAGGRLTKEELAEIAHLLPAAQGPYSVVLTEARYRRPYREYAAFYSVDISTIKWWVKQGKKNPKGPDLPPLDTPREMPAWWERDRGNMKQRCPDNVLAAARADGADQRAEVARAPTVARDAVTVGTVSRVTTAPASPDEGFLENLRTLREQRAVAYQELLNAQSDAPVDNAKVEQCRRRFVQMDAAAQRAEEKAPDILEKLGRYLDKDELAQDLGRMLKNLADSLWSLRRRLKPRLAQAADEAEEDAIWQSGLDEAFEELRLSGYAEPFALQAA